MGSPVTAAPTGRAKTWESFPHIWALCKRHGFSISIISLCLKVLPSKTYNHMNMMGFCRIPDRMRQCACRQGGWRIARQRVDRLRRRRGTARPIQPQVSQGNVGERRPGGKRVEPCALIERTPSSPKECCRSTRPRPRPCDRPQDRRPYRVRIPRPRRRLCARQQRSSRPQRKS